MPDEREDHLNPSTAPDRRKAEEGDREEGSYAPGISEYGPEHPHAPATRSGVEEDREDDQEDGEEA